MRLALEVLEEDRTFLNLSPKGEPRLGPRGLFADAETLGLFWILNFADGRNSLLDIAERAAFAVLATSRRRSATQECGLLAMVNDRAVE